MKLKDLLLILSRPQFWTGLALVLFTLGIAGPLAGFINTNVGLLAQLFGVIAQLLGFGTANRLEALANNYAARFQLALFQAEYDKEEIDQVMSQLK